MNGALIYRPNNRKLIWTSFLCAIAIHVTAVVLAESKSKPVMLLETPDLGDVIGDDVPISPAEIDEVLPPEQPPIEQQEFTDESVKQTPIRPRNRVSAVQSPSIGLARAGSIGSAKASALYAPKPNYPYEARRGGITGSGIAHLTVNSAAGNVIDARMSPSTGSPILDNATLSAFRRWRFKPGVSTNVDVPITYTLTGVTY